MVTNFFTPSRRHQTLRSLPGCLQHIAVAHAKLQLLKRFMNM